MTDLVDKLNPTNQFHPYQPADAIPHSEAPEEVSMFSKVRDYARSNPAVALGGLAAVAIGLGLLRRRG
jgi:hypothetical protein